MASSGARFTDTWTIGHRTAINERTSMGRAVLTGKRQYVPDATLDPLLPQDGPRSRLTIPFVRDGHVIGVLGVNRNKGEPFSAREIELLDIFADQAAIAIENVRLFNETNEALERQTATSDVLTAITRSAFELGPVLDTVVQTAVRLTKADWGNVFRLEGDRLRFVTASGKARPAYVEYVRANGLALDRHSASGRAVISRQTVHITDVLDDPEYQMREQQRLQGFRTVLCVPMIRDERVIGTIAVDRDEPRPFNEQEIALIETFGDQAAIAIENVRLFNETKESLERQTAMSEILRVISASPTDVQPVLDAVARSARKFCGAEDVVVALADGDIIRIRAHDGPLPPPEGTFAIDRRTQTTRSMVDRTTVHVLDMQAETEEFPIGSEVARRTGRRTGLAAPLLREGKAIGALLLQRSEVRAFTEKEIELAKIFADQAVIAIENVRLFNETKESLERQTAQAAVLRSIAGSPTDVQPVLDVIVESAARFTGAEDVNIRLAESNELPVRAHWGPIPLAGTERFAIDPGSIASTAYLERHTVHLADMLGPEGDLFPISKERARLTGHRALLATPLLREGRSIGVIVLRKSVPVAFTAEQRKLVETFADQAVIAIENVRLFNETKDALERQTATAEVLRVISQSPSDLQPVFDSIADHARTLCAAERVHLWLLHDDKFELVATGRDPSAPFDDMRVRSMPFARTNIASRAVQSRAAVQVADVLSDPEYDPSIQEGSQPWRTTLAVPLLRAGEAIGAIALLRAQVRPFEARHIELVETFADQAAIAIENVRLFNETKASLDRQTAQAAVLRAIAGSPTDVKPVLDAIAENAARFAAAEDVVVLIAEGDHLNSVSHVGPMPTAVQGPLRLERTSIGATAILDRRTVNVGDVLGPEGEEFTQARERVYATGQRALLAVPLVRDQRAIGAILLRKTEVGRFDETKVKLVEAFADQAVIAIENVRLFNETKESLERQTATSAVLQSISRARHDVRPVLQTIVESAQRLCVADWAGFFRRDGDDVVMEATAGAWTGARVVGERREIGKQGYVRLAFLERRTFNVSDMQAPEVWEYFKKTAPEGLAHGYQTPEDWASAMRSARSRLIVPVVHGGEVLGVIRVHRERPGGFTQRQVELIESFAAQAAIAIENVRLFNETNQSLERQTAVADVLKTISQTTFDLQAVFDVVVENATKLCRGDFGYLFRREGDVFRMVASTGGTPALAEYERTHPTPIDRKTLIGRMALDRALVHIPDVFVEPGYEWPPNLDAGVHTVAAVPIFSGGEVVGAIGAGRFRVEPYSAEELRLFETFADQAGIAMENVRLFNETKEGLERQTAIAEILRVMSESPTDIQPVLDAIARNAVRYCAAEDCGVALVRPDSMLEQVAQFGPMTANIPAWPIDRGSVRGRAIVDRRVVHVPDMLAEGEREYPIGRQRARDLGQRTVLAAPLMRKGVALGAIALRRTEVRPFTDRQIELLRTFADQAAIAIENVRLFNETKASLEQQTATAEILRVISSSPTDVQPVLDAIARSAAEYCGAEDATVGILDGQLWTIRAHHGSVELRQDVATVTFADGGIRRDFVSGRAMAERRTVHVPDLQEATAEFPQGASVSPTTRAIVATPLLKGKASIGAIFLRRTVPLAFTARQIELLETFASQAVIAIENVRLFNETKDALEQQTAIADILRVISASPTDTQPVLDAIAQSATRFAAAEDAAVLLVRGDEAVPVSHHGPIPMPIGVPVGPDSVSGRAILEARTIQAEDVTASDEYPRSKQAGLDDGQRTVLAAPLMRAGKALGVIVMRRREARPFAEQQVELAQTFANQAAIALENVRLFNETKESLEQQTALSEVLKTISRTVFDIDTTLGAIVENAGRLVAADLAWITQRADEDHFSVHTRWASSPKLAERFDTMAPATMFTRPISAGLSVMSRLYQDGTVARFDDVMTRPDLVKNSPVVRVTRSRSLIGVPLRNEQKVIGAFILSRVDVRPFTDREVQLAETFADQASIAMQNVRLFSEIQEKGRELEV
ncbi:MAG TPA: GAF domain-containing protein, partial [Candidatus Acidoferrales bacterium]|nr:GAF domain-containing protein [Candidatus Acidoferrales bacterium]